MYSKNGWYLFENLRPFSDALHITKLPAVVSQESDIYKLSSPDRPVIFEAGQQRTTIRSTNQSEEAPIISSNNQSNHIPYNRLSATKVTSQFNSSSGSMLVFTETFDNGWKAYINGQKVDSIQVNGMINGFPINTNGKVLVSIEYEPQKFFDIGVIISVVYIASFILIGMTRKHITQRISALMNIRSR